MYYIVYKYKYTVSGLHCNFPLAERMNPNVPNIHASTVVEAHDLSKQI